MWFSNGDEFPGDNVPDPSDCGNRRGQPYPFNLVVQL